jgi:hypothetical protein
MEIGCYDTKKKKRSIVYKLLCCMKKEKKDSRDKRKGIYISKIETKLGLSNLLLDKDNALDWSKYAPR